MPGNDAIGELIRSVVFEEMTHMTLACNILNATGGAPVIDQPGFIPTYPGPLPGGVEAGLSVGLEAFSKTVVKNVFMEIEEPENPIEFPDPTLELATTATIGSFYTALSNAIGEAGESLFPANPANPQVTGAFARLGVRAVTDVATAQLAIKTIIDQGEGTPQDPMDSIDGEIEPAHYYRFAEIWHGHELAATGAPPTAPVEERYAYTGAEIPFDPDGVQPARANPTEATLPVAPGVPNPKFACQTFNYTYTALLKSLHTTFNGDPSALTPADRADGIAQGAGDRADGDPARRRDERRAELRIHARAGGAGLGPGAELTARAGRHIAGEATRRIKGPHRVGQTHPRPGGNPAGPASRRESRWTGDDRRDPALRRRPHGVALAVPRALRAGRDRRLLSDRAERDLGHHRRRVRRHGRPGTPARHPRRGAGRVRR